MSGGAIVMMLLAMVVLWGGLALAVFNITRPRPPARASASTDPDLGITGSADENR